MDQTDAYFNAVYDETFRELAKVCVQKARQIPDVDDLLQNTYTRFYRHIRRHGINKIRDPKAYLYTILRKELSRYFRFSKSRFIRSPRRRSGYSGSRHPRGSGNR